MRVTDTMKYASSIANLNSTSSALQRANQVASSGENIVDPSDNPPGWASMSELQSRMTILAARSTAVKSSAGDLDIAESSLSSASDLMVQAKSIALSMATGTVSASDRKNSAAQIDSIRSQLLTLANTKGASGYLFGGNQTLNEPFDSNGKFLGDNGTRTLQVSESKNVDRQRQRADAFTSSGGGRDIFSDLAQLSTDLSSNNLSGITSGIDTMDAGDKQLIDARVSAGSLAGTLSAAGSAMDSLVTSLTTSRGDIGDADMTTAYSNLVAAQQSYSAALTVSQRLLAMSSLASSG